MLLEDERKFLERAARAAIESVLTDKGLPEYTSIPTTLLEPMGAFVSLSKKGRLRGCIGYMEAVKPLIRTVQEVAVKAAFDDPRFSPLTREELPNVRIEISVLSPLERVDDVTTIVVGRHGLVLELAGRRGLLLPQVALENHWDPETFLENTALKAGLSPDDWKHPAATILKFSAEVFSEDVESPREHSAP